MGVADGPQYAPVPEDARSVIEQPPCPCAECVAGPGLNIPRLRNHMAQVARRRQARELSSRQTMDELLAKAGLPPRS